jgi:hypothetical protein
MADADCVAVALADADDEVLAVVLLSPQAASANAVATTTSANADAADARARNPPDSSMICPSPSGMARRPEAAGPLLVAGRQRPAATSAERPASRIYFTA